MCLPFVLILIVKFSWLCGSCKFFLFLFWSLTKFLFPAGSKMRVCCSWWDCLHCPGNITSYIPENIGLHGGFGKWILCKNLNLLYVNYWFIESGLIFFLSQRLQQELQTNPGSHSFDEVHLLFLLENLFYITSVAE